MKIIKWSECLWTKIMQCRFCDHIYKNAEGYPNILIGDKLGEDHLRRLVESHMKLCHKGKIVLYTCKLWIR